MIFVTRMTVAAVAITTVLFSTASATETTLEAYSGSPFGIGKLRIEYSDELQQVFRGLDENLPDDALLQLGPDAFYPVAERSGIGRGKDDSGTTWTVYFLFQPGEQVSVHNPFGGTTTANVADDAAIAKNQLKRWWQLYIARARQSAAADRYSPEVDQYLLTMLAKRLDQSVPDLRGRRYLPADQMSQAISFIAGTESIRLAMQRDSLLQTSRTDLKAEYPLPEGVLPPAIEIPDVKGRVDIEPIAYVVPQECLYVRFGNFDNFTWFRDRVEEWGSDLRDMASARALDYRISKRFSHQLQLQDTELARLLGPTVIRDVAIIGTDTFVREGAGLGVLFHAASNTVLSANLKMQRQAALENNPKATLTPATFDGLSQQGTLLATPDNRIRSFYVTHGDFHLVTTSRYVAERFLQAAGNRSDSLGSQDEFLYARSQMPLSRNDSVFIYLSDAFFRRLVSPEFRVEMTRRAKSENEIQLLQFAQLAAAGEGQGAASIDELIQGKYLPRGFGDRADGSELVTAGAEFLDTMRGARGSFIPVCDVHIDRVTSREVQSYRTFAAKYRALWNMMDPATVAINRKQTGDQEHVTMDLHVYPFPVREYGLLTSFSQGKSQKAMSLPEKAVILVEGNMFGGSPMFAGMLDQSLPFSVTNDGTINVNWDNAMTSSWFVGSMGNSGLWSFWGNQKFKQDEYITEESPGSHNSINRVTYRTGDLSVASNQQVVIESVLDELKLQPASREAQYRLHIGDLKNSRAIALPHARAWSQARVISRGNAALLNRLTSQFHVPQQDALSTAEAILGGAVVCPFDGQYELKAPAALKTIPDAKELWISSKQPRWQDYRLGILNRWRQGLFEITLEGTTLTTHVELRLDRPKPAPGSVTSR